MLDDVGASDLNLLWQPQLVVELEDVEYESGDSPGPGCDDEETDHLAPDLVHDGDLVISIKHSAGSDDEGSSQDSHYPTARVDSNSVQRVVNPEPDDGVVDYHVHQGGQKVAQGAALSQEAQVAIIPQRIPLMVERRLHFFLKNLKLRRVTMPLLVPPIIVLTIALWTMSLSS